MTDHKRPDYRIRFSEEFWKFVHARCGDVDDAGEWIEKQVKASIRKEGKEQALLKEIERLKAQQPQCQPEATTHDLAVREKSQETQTQDAESSVLTVTEIISPNTQTVIIGGKEVRVSSSQKEKKVLGKDGQWTFSMNAAGNLSFLDDVGKLGVFYTRAREMERNKVRAEGLREREEIRLRMKAKADYIAWVKRTDIDVVLKWSLPKYGADSMRRELQEDGLLSQEFINKIDWWERLRTLTSTELDTLLTEHGSERVSEVLQSWGLLSQGIEDKIGIWKRAHPSTVMEQRTGGEANRTFHNETPSEQQVKEKNESSAPMRWCNAEQMLVPSSTCENVCMRVNCKNCKNLKAKEPSVSVQQPQIQRSSQFKCPAGNNVHPEACLTCQQKRLEPRCPKISKYAPKKA